MNTSASLTELSALLGLREADISKIREACLGKPKVKRVVIYGSRAKGQARRDSDVDIALYGEGVAPEHVLELSGYLNEETTMPYDFDVTHYDSLTNENLKQNIDRVAVDLL